MKRWSVTITYRTTAGLRDVLHEVEELSEISDLVERGPNWNAIINISVQLSRVTEPGFTIDSPVDI
jgi:hypothetical protein